jgi:hypothetical protein
MNNERNSYIGTVNLFLPQSGTLTRAHIPQVPKLWTLTPLKLFSTLGADMAKTLQNARASTICTFSKIPLAPECRWSTLGDRHTARATSLARVTDYCGPGTARATRHPRDGQP